MIIKVDAADHHRSKISKMFRDKRLFGKTTTSIHHEVIGDFTNMKDVVMNHQFA